MGRHLMVRAIVHMVLHFVVPAAVSAAIYRKYFFRAWMVMVATMLVDLDHLLASPVYDSQRCSIGFHPLHQAPAIAVYFALAALPRTRLIGIGLLIHMLLDGTDCLWMTYEN